jgi:hypothetical protein
LVNQNLEVSDLIVLIHVLNLLLLQLLMLMQFLLEVLNLLSLGRLEVLKLLSLGDGGLLFMPQKAIMLE